MQLFSELIQEDISQDEYEFPDTLEIRKKKLSPPKEKHNRDFIKKGSSKIIKVFNATPSRISSKTDSLPKIGKEQLRLF